MTLHDPVLIMVDYPDETYGVTPIMSRWEAEITLRCFGEFGMKYEGRVVKQATIVPVERYDPQR